MAFKLKRKKRRSSGSRISFRQSTTTKINYDYILDFEQKRIGTVHTFQGKEADEVIFVLECDKSREAKGAIKWVTPNIVNVAATRAKYFNKKLTKKEKNHGLQNLFKKLS